MTYQIEYLESVKKTVRKLDPQTRTRLRKFLNRLVDRNPRDIGKRLTGSNTEIWRYRIGDFRLLCEIQDLRLIILVIDFDHRSQIYQNR